MKYWAHYDRGKILLIQHQIEAGDFKSAFLIAEETAKKEQWKIAQLSIFRYTEHSAFEVYNAVR